MDNVLVSSGQLHAHHVGDLHQVLVNPNSQAVLAVPVLLVAFGVAAGLNSVHMDNVLVGSGQDHAQVVGDHGQSLVSPDSLTVLAVPVLDVAFGVAAGSNSVHMDQVLVLAGAFYLTSSLEGGGDGQSGFGSEPILAYNVQCANEDSDLIASLDGNGNRIGIAIGVVEGVAIFVGRPVIGIDDLVHTIGPVVAFDGQSQLAVFRCDPLVGILIGILGQIQLGGVVDRQIIGVVLGAQGPAQNKRISSIRIGIIGQGKCAGAPEIEGIQGFHHAMELTVDEQFHANNTFNAEPNGFTSGNGHGAGSLGIFLVPLNHLEGDVQRIDFSTGQITIEGSAAVHAGLDQIVHIVYVVAIVALQPHVLVGAGNREGGGDGQSGFGSEPILAYNVQCANEDSDLIASLDGNGNRIGIAIGVVEGVAIFVGRPVIGIDDLVHTIGPVVAFDGQSQLAVFRCDPLVGILIGILGQIQLGGVVDRQIIGVVLGAQGPAQNKRISSIRIGIIGQGKCAGAPEIEGIQGFHHAMELTVDEQFHANNTFNAEPNGFTSGNGHGAGSLGIFLVPLNHLEGDVQRIDFSTGQITIEGFAAVHAGLDQIIHIVVFVAVVALQPHVLVGANGLNRSGNSLDHSSGHQAEATVVIAFRGNQLVGASGQIFVGQSGLGGGGNLSQAFHIGHDLQSIHIDQRNSGGVAATGGRNNKGHFCNTGGGELQSAGAVLGDLNGIHAALAVLVALGHGANNGEETIGKGGAFGDCSLVFGATDVNVYQRVKDMLHSCSCNRLKGEISVVVARTKAPQVDLDHIAGSNGSRQVSADLIAVQVHNDHAVFATVSNIQNTGLSSNDLVVDICIGVKSAFQSYRQGLDDPGIRRSAGAVHIAAFASGSEGSSEVKGGSLVVILADLDPHHALSSQFYRHAVALFGNSIIKSHVVDIDLTEGSAFAVVSKVDGQGAGNIGAPGIEIIHLRCAFRVSLNRNGVFTEFQDVHIVQRTDGILFRKDSGREGHQHYQYNKNANNLLHSIFLLFV